MRFGTLHLTLCRSCLGETGDWSACWACHGHALRTVRTVEDADLTVAIEWTGTDLRMVMEPTERFRIWLQLGDG